MKNRLIYSLVALMVVSLIGIIVLQSLWVSKAIAEQEEEFENQVNTALNDVNSGIDEEEAVFFLESKFQDLGEELEELEVELGGLDEIIHIGEHIDINGTRIESSENQIQISINDEGSEVSYEYIEGDDVSLHDLEDVISKIEVQVQDIEGEGDSLILITEQQHNKLENITSVVRRYVLEQDFSGDLSDRVSKPILDSLIKKALKKQGILLQPQYAVYNTEDKEILPEFVSADFDLARKDHSFKKELFPSDRTIDQNFELLVQFDGANGLVWSGVQSIVLLCVLFTLLILVCFGYSLHFIFKQKRMSQVKNDFINNMTHELKTPLASISLAASSIQHPNVINDPEEIQRLIGIIRSEERRMNEHVERVLDVAALDSEELKMSMEPVDVIELIHESLEHVQLSIDAKNGNVQFMHSLESAPLPADKFHMLSAFINILDNSVKYQNGELQLKIDLSVSANNYVLRFQDNGIGMKKAAVKRAFDKFYREETGNIHTRKGFGLGLSYVKSIVEAHDGTIELTSEVSKGTVVTIKLPNE
ncbi:MAG: sensor histidine kinase [Crocinitomicaceae bacterium]